MRSRILSDNFHVIRSELESYNFWRLKTFVSEWIIQRYSMTKKRMFDAEIMRLE